VQSLQRGNAIKTEVSVSGLRAGQFLCRHAVYCVQHSTIHRETVCIKQVSKSAIPGQSSERVFAARPIPDHVRLSHFGHPMLAFTPRSNNRGNTHHAFRGVTCFAFEIAHD
jgi:hypothetical protein